MKVFVCSDVGERDLESFRRQAIQVRVVLEYGPWDVPEPTLQYYEVMTMMAVAMMGMCSLG
jgi:hypothetical protein